MKINTIADIQKIKKRSSESQTHFELKKLALKYLLEEYKNFDVHLEEESNIDGTIPDISLIDILNDKEIHVEIVASNYSRQIAEKLWIHSTKCDLKVVVPWMNYYFMESEKIFFPWLPRTEKVKRFIYELLEKDGLTNYCSNCVVTCSENYYDFEDELTKNLILENCIYLKRRCEVLPIKENKVFNIVNRDGNILKSLYDDRMY